MVTHTLQRDNCVLYLKNGLCNHISSAWERQFHLSLREKAEKGSVLGGFISGLVLATLAFFAHPSRVQYLHLLVVYWT